MQIKYLNLTIKFTLLLIFTFFVAQEAKAQTAYGVSDIVYDSTTKKVTSYSGTYLNYLARLHYDPAVCGTMYQEYAELGGHCFTGYNSSWNNKPGSLVRLRTNFQSPIDTQYDVISDHYVVAYFYVDIFILDDDRTPVPARRWYDPLSLNKQGGQNLGSYNYQGNSNYDNAQFFESEYFYLGSTAKAVIGNPTYCPALASTLSGEASGTCSAPLNVKITNEFTGDQDLGASSTARKALLGGAVELQAKVSGGNGTLLSYSWLKDNVPVDGCNSAQCSFLFDDKKSYNVKVTVTQSGQTPITKQLTVEGVLPTFTAVTTSPYPIRNGYSGIERTPRVTRGGECSNPGQRIMLGCTEGNPHLGISPTLRDKDIGGVYLRANVTVPTDLISKKDQTAVAFYQVIKPRAFRSGRTSNGQDFTEEFRYIVNHNQWKLDFQGELVPSTTFNYSSRLTKADSSGNVILDYSDTPSDPLPNQTQTGDPLTEYKIDQEFRTYITYYTVPLNVGRGLRYALRVIDWKWNAKAAREASATSLWRLSGAYFPASEGLLDSQAIPFVKDNSGEQPAIGRFGDLREWFRLQTPASTVTLTTKRDIAVWRKTNGGWYVMNSDGSVRGTLWGTDYDIPVPGDYDGDGRVDFAVYRPDNPSTAENECQNGCSWYIFKSSDNGLLTSMHGSIGDIPVPADYDGDGRTDMAVFRPGNSTWYFINSTNGAFRGTQFGAAGDIPMPSDYDGDGFDDIAVWRSSDATWSVLNSSTRMMSVRQWGTGADKPVTGDFDGDGKTDIANWQSNGNWHILLSSNSQTMDVHFGVPATDKPVPGDYDGDGKTDIAVWRPNGTDPAQWWILKSSNNEMYMQYWGTQGDIPVPAAYR